MNQYNQQRKIMNKQYQIPYVILINDKGDGFTLDRQYRLLHPRVDKAKAKAVLPLALKAEKGWSPTGKNQMPNWARKVNRTLCPLSNKMTPIYYCDGFTAYWFIDKFEKGHDAVKNAWETTPTDKGVVYHFETVKEVNDAIAKAKKAQRREMIDYYRKEFKCWKPFFSGGEIRFYVAHPELQDALTGWNDDWFTQRRFSKQALNACLASVTRFLIEEGLTGSFNICLEGEYSACASMEEHKYNGHTPWGDFWEVEPVATVTV